MASRPQVPKFGNWENEEDVPYTVYFEKAKKNRKEKANPQNPDSSSINGPAVQSGEEAEVKNGGLTKPETSQKTLDRRVSEEEADLRKSRDSPTHQKRVSRQSVGSDRSFDTSPMHPHNQPKIGNRGSASSSPISERKTSLESGRAASSNPGKSRLKQVTRGDESLDDGTVIPKFGGWDDTDPASGEGYTGIFNKAREDKQNGGKSPMITTENANYYGQTRQSNDDNSKGCGCFPWSRK